MRHLGILAIWAYRLCVRPFLRRRCLHAESCSAYGLRMFRTHGLVAALPLIRTRVRACRLPATACFVLDGDGMHLLSASGHDGTTPPARAVELAKGFARWRS